jgi:hypothetical protein
VTLRTRRGLRPRLRLFGALAGGSSQGLDADLQLGGDGESRTAPLMTIANPSPVANCTARAMLGAAVQCPLTRMLQKLASPPATHSTRLPVQQPGLHESVADRCGRLPPPGQSPHWSPARPPGLSAVLNVLLLQPLDGCCRRTTRPTRSVGCARCARTRRGLGAWMPRGLIHIPFLVGQTFLVLGHGVNPRSGGCGRRA